MVEVLYSCKEGKYPFGRSKETELTYMEYLLEAQNETEVNKYRQLNAIVKKLNNPNIIRLQKVLKEDMSFHMIYEYYNKSLEERLKLLEDTEELTNLFLELENVFETLIQQKLKAQLYLDFMAVDQQNRLKVWLKPNQLQFLGHCGEQDKKLKKILIQFYETQRTRIHLEIQQIFQTSELNYLKKNTKHKQSQKDNNSRNTLSTKAKTPNFIIEGNTLVFLNKSNDKIQPNISKNTQQTHNDLHAMNKVNHGVYEERPISKTENVTNPLTHAPEIPDISKMSVAQKVLYYKKQKQNASHHETSQETPLIVKDSSTSNVSQNDLSKSSNNDSNLQIKTEMINKHKMKITTSQEVEIEGNSDDDLEKLARQKIAKLNREKHGKNHDNSTETGTKTNTSGHSGDVQKLLKGIDQHSVQEKNEQKIQDQSKEINSKIAQAKLKAKNILDKYNQKLKK